MSETKGLVKCVLGFILSILVIVGGAFGFDVQVNVEDTGETLSEVVETITEGEDVSQTDEVVETEEQSTVESAPTEDEEQSADESVEAEVTEPTDDHQ